MKLPAIVGPVDCTAYRACIAHENHNNTALIDLPLSIAERRLIALRRKTYARFEGILKDMRLCWGQS